MMVTVEMICATRDEFKEVLDAAIAQVLRTTKKDYDVFELAPESEIDEIELEDGSYIRIFVGCARCTDTDGQVSWSVDFTIEPRDQDDEIIADDVDMFDATDPDELERFCKKWNSLAEARITRDNED